MNIDLVLLAICLVPTVGSVSGHWKDRRRQNLHPRSSSRQTASCRLYLAESTVKDGGWGVFAGEDVAFGAPVGEPSIGIQLMDPSKNPTFHSETVLYEFLMGSGVLGGFYEADEVLTVATGIAMLANRDPIYSNVVEQGFVRDIDVNPATHKMAGSSTNYHDLSFLASRDIHAGDEIFIGPTMQWANGAQLPLREHLLRANDIASVLVDYNRRHPGLSEAVWVDLLHRVRNELLRGEDRVRDLLPKTLDELITFSQSNTFEKDHIGRTMEWLKQNGKCLDNIRAGESTVDGAGRGAFATRFIPKGSLVTPAPLVQIINKDSLDIATETQSTKQQLLNYCFGHWKSQLLLCPTSHAALINHNSRDPNAELRWAKTSANRNDTELQYWTENLSALSVERGSLAALNSRLMFDVVATKDIMKGEEIFFDYGKRWEDALSDHLASWNVLERKGDLAWKLNHEVSPISVSNDPGPPSYECKLEPFATENPASAIENYGSSAAINPESWATTLRMFVERNNFLLWYPCRVLKIVQDNKIFMVEVFSKLTKRGTKIRVFNDLPRHAIRYVDRKYSSNQFLRDSFRHFIPIPDNIFPLRWRNDYLGIQDIKLGDSDTGIDMTSPENRHHLDAHEKVLREAKCGIYFAPSNIIDGGFGTFSALPIHGKGVIVGSELPVIAVPRDFPEPWSGSDYSWGPLLFGVEYETAESLLTAVLFPDVGSLTNFHPGLVNLEVNAPTFKPRLDRCQDPGAGAFSDYIQSSVTSRHSVDAGVELFIDYGDDWLTGRTRFSDVALRDSYDEANRLISSVWSTSSVAGQIMSRYEAIDFIENVGAAVFKKHRTQTVLRSLRTFDDVQRAVLRNGTAQASVATASQEWLEKNGYCLDSIYIKESTVPQAGHGAFLRRKMKQDSVITSSPLLATRGRGRFNHTNGKVLQYDVNPTNLLLNYQFSHPQSSIYLQPVTSSLFINHQSDRIDPSKAPNARVRFSGKNARSNYYLQRPLDDLRNERDAIIILDIVATRDIDVDEEVFIDYGVEWEEAWDRHVRDYRQPCGVTSKSSKEVFEMNDNKANATNFEWSRWHFTSCRKVAEYKQDVIFLVPPTTPRGMLPRDEAVRGSIHEAFEGIRWDSEGFLLAKTLSFFAPCQLLSYHPDIDRFQALYYLDSEAKVVGGVAGVRKLQVVMVPPWDVNYLNKPFTSDMFWKGAFRHEIHIPDDSFPLHWRDLG